MKVIYKLNLIFIIISAFNCSKSDTSKPDTSQDALKVSTQTFGGTKNESAQSIVKTSDGGYAILGHAQSLDGDVTNKLNDSFDFWLLKFNQNSTLQWQKNFGGTDDDRGSDIIQTNDNGFALIGYSKSNDGEVSENAGTNDYWVIKTDSSGNLAWQKSFGFLGSDNGISIIQTNDNGFLLSGVLDVTASNGEGNSRSTAKKIQHAGGDYWVIKLNASGEKQWSKYFGGTFTDTAYDAIQTNDNGYIIVGSSDSDDVDIKGNKGTYDFWVLRISENGGLIWEKSFGGSQIDEAYAITESNDGNYIIVGDTRSDDKDVSFNNGAADLWIIKISESGELIWDKSIGGTSFDVGRSISKTKDNNFIISGSSRSADGDVIKNNGQNDAWVVKIDNNGNLLWQKTAGGLNIDFTYNAIELDNGNIIAVGESNSSDLDIETNKGFSDLLILTIKNSK